MTGYTAVNPVATACAPCEAGDHVGCAFWGCACYLDHRRLGLTPIPTVRPVLLIADLAPEDGPAADPEYDGGLGSGDWLRPYIEHRETTD